MALLDYFDSDIQFECFHPEVEYDGRKPIRYTPIRLHGTLSSKQAELQRYNDMGYGIYFTVNALDDLKQRKDENITGARAVWIEDDGDKHGVTDPSQFPIAPSAIVESSPGKFHYYWFTKTPDIEEWQRVVNGMCKTYHGDPGGIKKVQVLRVPGFLNTKYDNAMMVTFVGGNFKQYDWEEITRHFPPLGEAKTGEQKSSRTSDSDFSLKQAIKDLLLGDSVYPSALAIAYSYANRGMNRGTLIDTISGLLDGCQADKDRIDNVRVKLEEIVDTAIAKIKKEAGVDQDDYEEEYGGGSEFTNLPWPVGMVGEIARYINEGMPFPSKEIAIATAFHTISVLGGGCYTFQGVPVSRSRIILAPNGRGKATAGTFVEAAYKCVEGVDARDMFNMAVAFSAFNNHQKMNMCRVGSIMSSEAGLLNSSASGDKANLSRYMLDGLSIKTNGGPLTMVEPSKRGQKGINEVLSPVYAPVLVSLEESTPESYLAAAAKTKFMESGAMARAEVFLIDVEDSVNEEFYKHNGVPEHIAPMFNAMVRQFHNSDTLDGTKKDVFNRLTEVDSSQITSRLRNMFANSLVQKKEAGMDPLKRALVTRYIEKVMSTSMVMAIADSIDISSDKATPPVITAAHWDYAIAYHNELNRAISLNMTGGGVMDGPIGIVMSIMEQKLSTLNTPADKLGLKKNAKLVEKEDNKKVFTKSWVSGHFKTGDAHFKAFMAAYPYKEPKQVRQILIDEAESAGMIVKVIADGTLSHYISKVNIKKG